MRMCVVLGRIRMASQPLGIDLGLDRLDLAKYWDKPSDQILIDKLVETTWGHVKESGVTFADWRARVTEMPADDAMCCGKDLLRSSRLFFRGLYGMDNKVTADAIAMMLRLALDDERFESWTVVERIHKWEALNGRKVFNITI
jgi:hypothetical protein